MDFRIHCYVVAFLKPFFLFAPYFPDEKGDMFFMHEILYLRGGQAGDTHAFLVGRVTQRSQCNIPNLIYGKCYTCSFNLVLDRLIATHAISTNNRTYIFEFFYVGKSR